MFQQCPNIYMNMYIHIDEVNLPHHQINMDEIIYDIIMHLMEILCSDWLNDV